MTYDSLEILPYKLFLKISNSGDVSLLTDDKEQLLTAAKLWEKLQEEFNLLDPDNKLKKLLRTLVEIEEYRNQYDGLQIAIKALRFDRDIDLENEIREQGFTLTEDSFDHDLDRVEQESQALLMFIEELEATLPNHNGEKATNIDKIILGYGSFTGMQYTDTNAITVTQFYALKELFDEKLKVVKEQQSKNKKFK